MKHLILGGARSGKSRYAESLSLQEHSPNSNYWYVATATPRQDSEMLSRIEQHKNSRDKKWQLVEEPTNLAEAIARYNTPQDCILIDCLTLWLTNCLLENNWQEQKENFLDAISQTKASIYCVSNEVGSGIVPLGELSRQFVDEAGALHQVLAQQCDKVTLVVAGMPLALKQEK